MRAHSLAGMIAAAALCGCGGSAMVKYHDGAQAAAGEYLFVVPRTVVRIDVPAPSATAGAAAKPATALTFTPVPLATDDQGKDLPVYSVTDDSSGTFQWVSTTVTSVTYADHLIVQSIGTAITDNRKAVIDAVFSVVGLVKAGAFASEGAPDCTKASLDQFKPFVLTAFAPTGSQFQRIDNNPCWAYQVNPDTLSGNTSVGAFPVGTGGIPLETRLGWFPYPACKSYRIVVAQCASNEGVCTPASAKSAFQAVVARSDGTMYRKIAFPPKGKITMHSNYCDADVTSDPSPLASNWDIANDVLTNTKALLKPAK